MESCFNLLYSILSGFHYVKYEGLLLFDSDFVSADLPCIF